MYDYKPKLLGLLESENPFALAKKEKLVPQTTKSGGDKKQMFTKFKKTHSRNISKNDPSPVKREYMKKKPTIQIE